MFQKIILLIAVSLFSSSCFSEKVGLEALKGGFSVLSGVEGANLESFDELCLIQLNWRDSHPTFTISGEGAVIYFYLREKGPIVEISVSDGESLSFDVVEVEKMSIESIEKIKKKHDFLKPSNKVQGLKLFFGELQQWSGLRLLLVESESGRFGIFSKVLFENQINEEEFSCMVTL